MIRRIVIDIKQEEVAFYKVLNQGDVLLQTVIFTSKNSGSESKGNVIIARVFYRRLAYALNADIEITAYHHGG